MKNIFTRTILTRFGIGISLLTILITPIANATTGKYDEPFYSSNDILFYNPEDNTCSQSSSLSSSKSAASLTGSTNAEKIWNWLKAQGLSSEQAAGVMGNLQSEGGFSPTRQEGGQSWPVGGWGLVQWTNVPLGATTGRRTAVVASLNGQAGLPAYYSNSYGGPAGASGSFPGIPADINIRLLDFELNYMMQESQGRKVSKSVASQGFGTAGASEWDTLKQQKTIEDATVFWHNNFEVSADSPATVIKNRGGNAISAFNSFSGSIAPVAGGVGSSPATSAASCPSSATSSTSGTFAQKVLAYAWPDYKSGYTQKMPDYAAAIVKAKLEGRYVGNDGIDCGGFITTLMVDSGFDPTYNSSGKGGPTGAQQAWLDAHWDNLGKGTSVNPANLKPGDVAMMPGHTFLFVGNIPGFNSVIASASNGVRAPMAGQESPTNSSVTWYRKKG